MKSVQIRKYLCSVPLSIMLLWEGNISKPTFEKNILNMIKACRLCHSEALVEVLNLGQFSLSGVFPLTPKESLSSGDLILILCTDCSLVQLSDTFSPSEMYGVNYGYRSGLNASMVSHLNQIVHYASSMVDVGAEDVVLDIGSNDGTLLRAWGLAPLRKIGMDPSAEKFREHYDNASTVIVDYFSAQSYKNVISTQAKVVTSIAMLYDLEDPVDFARDIREILAPDGIWVSEQSYMPWMVLTGAYDTICHEHIEYYSLTSLQFLMERADLKIINAEINGSNGGSVRIAVAHKNSEHQISSGVNEILEWEADLRLNDLSFFQEFVEFVSGHGKRLRTLLSQLKQGGKHIGALGASTKGSIVLQHAKLDSETLDFVADVNPFKFGRYMPNSNLMIREESSGLILSTDALLILPWHFRSTFSERLREFLESNGTIIWPLPSLVLETIEGRTVIFGMESGGLENTPLKSTLLT